MSVTSYPNLSLPVAAGLIGTGYAAKLRAETLQADERSQLVAVAGHTPEHTAEFAQTHGTEAAQNWQQLIERPDLDLVFICGVNRDHGPMVQAALAADKHVVVEYPLALDVDLATALIDLAQQRQRLLHVEHIELLGGLHGAMREYLPQVGQPYYARYSTINPQHPAPRRWTYHSDLFGFPLMAALSRIHRLTDLFGQVAEVNCQFVSDRATDGYFISCLCTAQLSFASGFVAEVTYGKGEKLWAAARRMEVHAEQAGLLFEGENGTLLTPDGTQPIEVGTRRGLFAKDTRSVLDHLTTGTPLYVSPAASLYALRVADAARRSAQTGQRISLLG
ncbi:Gfo/Idh/MocA family oxidoreductase [Sphaerothrix gracilis]|uniref:Gfo/Idh/MocA family protein n=1 Tax=Sphaerothrix gracilis TaxID=3151835 RepID=UPI0031FCC3B4